MGGDGKELAWASSSGGDRFHTEVRGLSAASNAATDRVEVPNGRRPREEFLEQALDGEYLNPLMLARSQEVITQTSARARVTCRRETHTVKPLPTVRREGALPEYSDSERLFKGLIVAWCKP